MSKSEKRKFINFFEKAYCEKAVGEFEKIDLEGRIERVFKDYTAGVTPGKIITKSKNSEMKSDIISDIQNLTLNIHAFRKCGTYALDPPNRH